MSVDRNRQGVGVCGPRPIPEPFAAVFEFPLRVNCRLMVWQPVTSFAVAIRGQYKLDSTHAPYSSSNNPQMPEAQLYKDPARCTQISLDTDNGSPAPLSHDQWPPPVAPDTEVDDALCWHGA